MNVSIFDLSWVFNGTRQSSDCSVRQVNHGADKLIGRKYDILKVLTTYLTEFSTYVRQNSSSIVDYLDQHRYKKRGPKVFVESTVYR